MLLESFLDLLEGVRPAWGYHKARCPAHEDRVQSLSIRVPGEWIKVKCFAGCEEQEILEALGLKNRDLRLDALLEERLETRDYGESLGRKSAVGRPSESARPADLSRFSEVYEYVGISNSVSYVVCRTSDKRFLQATPDPESSTKYVWGRRAKPILYRLPEVLRAVENGEDIYVVDGEKDVEAIRSLGGTATCCPGGMGSWNLAPYANTLRGARVLVVVDTHPAVSLEHAKEVSLSIEGGAPLVYPKVGKDAHDHIEAGYGLDDFLERTWTPSFSR